MKYLIPALLGGILGMALWSADLHPLKPRPAAPAPVVEVNHYGPRRAAGGYAYQLPEIEVKADDILRKALLNDIAEADVDASDECTFTAAGVPIAIWKGGTLTILP
jgi:hypothetical protein